MSTESPQEELTRLLSRQACKFAETIVQRETGREGLAEVVNSGERWSECRQVFEQHERVWGDHITITVALGADGKCTGYLTEQKKAASREALLDDVAVEKCARATEGIRASYSLQSVRRVAGEGGANYAVASFKDVGAGLQWDAYVNHSTGEIIGVLPGVNPKLRPVAGADGNASQALEAAWARFKHEIATKVGPSAAKDIRQKYKLVPLTALADEKGASLRVYRVWRLYSLCDVAIDITTKEIVGWFMDALQNTTSEKAISEEAALQVARQELQQREGAQGPKVEMPAGSDLGNILIHWWHAEGGVNIEGDQVTVQVNALTGKVFSVARKWRKVPKEVLAAPLVSMEKALQVADDNAKASGISFSGKIAGKNVIQLESQPGVRSAVRDVMVWRVVYTAPTVLGMTELAVDCQREAVVRKTGW